MEYPFEEFFRDHNQINSPLVPLASIPPKHLLPLVEQFFLLKHKGEQPLSRDRMTAYVSIAGCVDRYRQDFSDMGLLEESPAKGTLRPAKALLFALHALIVGQAKREIDIAEVKAISDSYISRN